MKISRPNLVKRKPTVNQYKLLNELIKAYKDNKSDMSYAFIAISLLAEKANTPYSSSSSLCKNLESQNFLESDKISM